MSKNKVISLIAIAILLGGIIFINNREWLSSGNNLEDEGVDTIKVDESKVTQIADGWELSEGEYYFGKDLPPGMYDFTTIKGEMSVDGKKLNENCSLRNYISIPEISLKISGNGCVVMKDISGRDLNLESNNNNVKIKESGYYFNSVIVNNETGEGKVRIYCEDVLETDFPIIVELQDSNSRIADKKIEILSCKDSFELEVINGQSLYVDLGKETKDWSGCVTVETLD